MTLDVRRGERLHPIDGTGGHGCGRQQALAVLGSSRIFRLSAAVLLIVGASCSKKPQPTPPIQRSDTSPYCHDETGYLGDAAEALSVCYENYFAKTDLEFTVVLLDSLAGKDIRRLAEKIVEAWGVGRHNHGRGVLVLLGLKEQRIRMEVTYALEPVLTDVFCNHLISDQVQPFLKQPGFLSLALQGAAIFVSDRLNLEEDEAARAIFTSWERDGLLAGGKPLAGGAGNTEDFEFAVGWESKTVLSAEARRAYLAQDDPVLTLNRYQDVLARRITDPHLDIFTEGSQLFGEVWPLDTLDAARELSRLRKAPTLRAEVMGDFAVVKSRPGDATSLPFFLIRGDDGRWRIDKVGNYKSLKVRHDGTFSMPFLTPYSFAYGASRESVAPLQREALVEARRSLRAQIQELKARIDRAPRDRRHYFELADLYYDRCLAIPYAYELYDKGLELRQDDYRLFLHAAWRYNQRKYAVRKALRCYEKAYELNPRSMTALRNIAIGYSYFKYHDKAERFLKRALGKKPTDEWLMLYRAINFSRMGRKEEALEWLRRSVEHGLPDNYVDYYERQTKTKVDRGALRSA